MRNSFNILLLPLSILYGFIAQVRRVIYNVFGLSKTTSIPTVVIGNLTLGGTGKTPMILFLADRLKSKYRISVLSRGYGRKSKGFIQVNSESNAIMVGDEPLEIFNQDKQLTGVYVCEDRYEGIERIKCSGKSTDLVLLDDGFQHLGIKATFSILLCDFNNPFFNDFVVPAGRLREFRINAKLADAIVVSKCPKYISPNVKQLFDNQLSKYCKQVFYAHYQISQPHCVMGLELDWHESLKFVLITGIANSDLILENVKNENVVHHFKYQDHNNYSWENVLEWIKTCTEKGISAILTTRKDYMRIKDVIKPQDLIMNAIGLFEIHTEVEILDSKENELLNTIKNKIK